MRNVTRRYLSTFRRLSACTAGHAVSPQVSEGYAFRRLRPKQQATECLGPRQIRPAILLPRAAGDQTDNTCWLYLAVQYCTTALCSMGQGRLLTLALAKQRFASLLPRDRLIHPGLPGCCFRSKWRNVWLGVGLRFLFLLLAEVQTEGCGCILRT